MLITYNPVSFWGVNFLLVRFRLIPMMLMLEAGCKIMLVILSRLTTPGITSVQMSFGSSYDLLLPVKLSPIAMVIYGPSSFPPLLLILSCSAPCSTSSSRLIQVSVCYRSQEVSKEVYRPQYSPCHKVRVGDRPRVHPI
jgi:hypothetical protein